MMFFRRARRKKYRLMPIRRIPYPIRKYGTTSCIQGAVAGTGRYRSAIPRIINNMPENSPM
jgi:hypothetical protein